MSEATEDAADVSGTESGTSPISIYGFTDFGFIKFLDAPSVVGSPYSSFSVGNFNLYLASELGSNWRSLSEVRFMYLPHGQVSAADQFNPAATRTDTTVGDYADSGRAIRWGGVSIQRAWVEHTFHELLTLRGGQFLSPYGIWNVDHGSPVIIGVRRPFIIAQSLFPESQTGLEAYGSFYVKATQFGYHLTLSNGRGPIDTYNDLDHNKALGGRLFVRTEGDFGTLAFGVSGYRGRYTDRIKRTSVDATGAVVMADPPVLEYSELSLAADVKWELANILVQGEVIMNEKAYGAARPADSGMMGGPPGFTPDNRQWGFYGLAGYRTPWWNIMPFAGGEYHHTGRQYMTTASAALWGGLNIRPVPRVVLKVQLSHVFFPEAPAFGTKFPSFGIAETQVAWSF